MGNLTRDPDLKYTPKGAAVCQLSLAINSTYTVNGQTREDVVYVDIEVWNASAEACKKCLTRGSPVHVEGRLKLDQWEKNGVKQSRLRVRAENVQFLSRKPEGQREPAGNSYDDASSGRPGGGQDYEPARQRQDARSASQGRSAGSTQGARTQAAPAGAQDDGEDDQSIPF